MSLLRPVRVVALFAAMAFAAPTSAQSDAEARVAGIVEDACADYDMLLLEEAEIQLLEAIELAQMAEVRTNTAASAWIMLGVVRQALGAESGVTLDAFVQALLIDYYVAVPVYYATPSLEQLLAQARTLVPAPSGPPPVAVAPPVVTPPPPVVVVPPPVVVAPPPVVVAPPVQVIQHLPARDALAGNPLLLSATVPASVPAARVVINFRPVGESTFFAVDMVGQPDGVSFIGEIPAAATRSSIQIDYYITVVDRIGGVLGSAGTPAAPISVVVFGGLEAPEERSERGGSTRADRDDRSEREEREERAPRDRSDDLRDPDDGYDEVFHFAVGGGTGVGLATGAPRVYANEVKINPGMAATPVHIHFELGGVATSSFHLVPFLRTQLVILETGIEPQFLAGLKARYFFADRGPLRAYAEGGLGYGNVSHLVYLADKDAYDTTIEGPFHVGAGIGLLYMFNDMIGLQNQVYTMAMFDQFSFQLDYSLGIYFAF